ncbi:VOC family protein [Bacillus sp. RG28]|uniref:VOC family protein n=1 Tax=Gottfriedia endophytica TaxID=2820819 RepID=A0A940NGT5_9BACI|nr:VOC family protein [Gottfriedia endophytica]MBP0723717.1 VOC family protein [Gottfriedia endophytica]
MNRINHFEFQVKNPKNAMDFYSNVFGWKFEQFGDQEYYFVVTGNEGQGINGGIMPSPDGEARTFNTVEVSSVDEYLEIVVKNGGEVVVPKNAIPGIGYVAYCKDPEGLIFGVYHNDREAK